MTLRVTLNQSGSGISFLLMVLFFCWFGGAKLLTFSDVAKFFFRMGCVACGGSRPRGGWACGGGRRRRGAQGSGGGRPARGSGGGRAARGSGGGGTGQGRRARDGWGGVRRLRPVPPPERPTCRPPAGATDVPAGPRSDRRAPRRRRRAWMGAACVRGDCIGVIISDLTDLPRLRAPSGHRNYPRNT